MYSCRLAVLDLYIVLVCEHVSEHVEHVTGAVGFGLTRCNVTPYAKIVTLYVLVAQDFNHTLYVMVLWMFLQFAPVLEHDLFYDISYKMRSNTILFKLPDEVYMFGRNRWEKIKKLTRSTVAVCSSLVLFEKKSVYTIDCLCC